MKDKDLCGWFVYEDEIIFWSTLNRFTSFRMRYFLLMLFLPSFLLASNPRIDSCLFKIDAFNADTFTIEYADLLVKKGACFANAEYYTDASTYYQRSLKISKAIDNRELILKNLINLGVANFWVAKYDTAIIFLENAVNNYGDVASSKDSTTIYITLGNTYYDMGKKHLSYRNTLSALQINSDQTDPQVIGDSYYVLALMDVDRKRYDSGMEKVNKALDSYKKIKNVKDQAFCYDVIARIYYETKQYELAIEYQVLSCEIDDDTKYAQYYTAYCAFQLGDIYEAMGDFNRAEALYKEALTIQKNSDQYGEKVETKAALARLYSKMGKCEKSSALLRECLKEVQQIKAKRPGLRDLYFEAFQANNNCGHYQKAIEFLQSHIALKDSLIDESNLEEVAQLSITNELQQQRQEVAILQKDKKLQTIYSYLMSGIMFILFLFTFLGVFAFNQQKKKNALLDKKNKTIASQNHALLSTNTDLTNANKELEEFAYVVSHDLKAPLRGISTLASFIEEDLAEEKSLENKEDVFENLKLLKGRIIRMGNLIKGILAYSRIGRIEDQSKYIDINELLREIIELLSPPQGTIINIDSNLPKIFAPKAAMQHIFQNILSNAIKYNITERHDF